MDVIDGQRSDDDYAAVLEAVKRHGRGPDAVVPILQAVQDHYRYLPEDALQKVCALTEITPAAIAGVSTFYSQFRHRPVGRHVISVCHGTACHVKGADQVTWALRRHLRLAGGEDTDSAGLFTLRKVACLGCCTLAPAVQIDDVTYGHLTADSAPKVLDDFLALKARAADRGAGQKGGSRGETEGEIRIGLGSCCISRGSGTLHDALLDVLDSTGVRARIKTVGCVGMCHQTPLLELLPPSGGSFLYAQVRPDDARAIVLRHFKPRGPIGRIRSVLSSLLDRLLTDERWEPVTRYSIDVRDGPVQAFLDKQKHIATEYCGQIAPVDLDEYLSHGGFEAARQCVAELSPEEVIDRVTQSGLRGRGGAGFPTGRKWAAVRAAADAARRAAADAANRAAADAPCYTICNGDEGDPGAFMDRMLLESYPYRIIEGMMIASFAVGAREGIFYIRAEYPLAVRRVREAVARCEERGLLGDNLFGTDYGLRLRVKQGAGAFVCGEETALIASIEGRRGMPRLRPPYPAERGLFGKPTLVNNVETFGLVPSIVRSPSAGNDSAADGAATGGAEAFSLLGTERSAGTKVFALAGKVARGGLIEVPMGISLRTIVEEIGGGIAGGRKLKAVQVGGPSGGCVPAALCHVAVDYESLAEAGAIMGSGGLVVLDEEDCMVDIARYFMEFIQSQSCGRCTFCRVGTRRMLDIMEALCAGQARSGDLDRLGELAHDVRGGSLCGLGRTAPNPVLSTLRHFRSEYEAHIDGRCPAGKCKALIAYTVNDNCIGCTLCAQHCGADAIALTPYEKHAIDAARCIRCGTCRNVCPFGAVDVTARGAKTEGG